MSGRRRPVRRRNVALGAVVALLIVTGVVLLAEWLHPPIPEPGWPGAADEPSSDPRVEAACPTIPESLEGGPGPFSPSVGPLTPAAVTSSMLHECPRVYDGALVAFRGEVVGAVLRRADGAWVHLNDDAFAGTGEALPAERDYRSGNDGIGVFVPHDVADRIGTVGGPRTRGDVVAVTGVFRRVDPITQEVAVIRAVAGDVTERGQSFEDVRQPDREVAAGLLAVAAFLLVVRERVGAARERRG